MSSAQRSGRVVFTADTLSEVLASQLPALLPHDALGCSQMESTVAYWYSTMTHR